MARSTVAQRQQIGREAAATPGTVVPANKRLNSLGFDLSSAVDSTVGRARGSKFPTIVSANKEWVEGDLVGTPTYDEIVYPLSSVLTLGSVAQIMDGATPTGVYEWTFSPITSGEDAPATFTVEEGQGGAGAIAERVSHVLVTDFGLEISRDSAEMSGSAIGQRMTTGATLTAAPTDVATNLVPILPNAVSIYVSNVRADVESQVIGAKQGKALSINPSIGGRFNPVWYLDAALTSFGTFVEAPEPDFTLEYMTEADAAGLAWLSRFRTGETQFVRIVAEGPGIYTGTTPAGYRMTMDFAVKTLEPGAKSDEDGVYAISPTLQVVHDPTWGRACEIKVRNKVSAL